MADGNKMPYTSMRYEARGRTRLTPRYRHVTFVGKSN